VTQLFIHDYSPGGPAVTKIDDVSPDMVVSAITNLDGHGELELLATGTWLAIAGGSDRLFIGYCSDADPQILQALADQPSGEAIEVMVGGQRTTLAPQYLVSPAVAQTAALHFLATGQPSPEITWQRM
jgi:hypothetical protein